MHWNEPIFNNYTRMFSDKVFMTSVGNTFLYLIIQVPIMLILAILLAQLLNNQHLRFKGFFRYLCIPALCDIPCILCVIFKSLFATDGLVNTISCKHWHPSGELQFPWKFRKRESRYHHCSDLEMDRIQHGILSGRSSEHRVFCL